MNSTGKVDLKLAERNARRVWVSIVVGLLSLQVVAGITTVILATGDPTVAIIPDYHQSAVNWDTTRRARQLTEKLGLEIKPRISLVDDATGRRAVQVKVKDRDGASVPGLVVEAQVFHHANGSDVYRMMLNEVERGVYVAQTQLVQPGLWQLDLRIGGQHGIAADSREVLVR